MALCLHDIIQLLTLSLMLLRTGLFLQSITDIQNLPEHPPTLYQVQYLSLIHIFSTAMSE